MFEDRESISRRRRRNLEDLFKGDLDATGIPALRQFAVDIAEQYLEQNYFEDILLRLGLEEGRLARYFRRELSTLEAHGLNQSNALMTFVENARQEVAPWIDHEIGNSVAVFQERLSIGARELAERTSLVRKLGQRRLQDKLDKWSGYAWNTLRSTARKGGVHTKWDGVHIDLSQDLCSVLVDDLILAWTTYRDSLIANGVRDLTNEFSEQLQARLAAAAAAATDVESQLAIADILEQVGHATHAQREQLISRVDAMIDAVESIRRPAYELVGKTMSPMMQKIASERGHGCAQRMRSHLHQGFDSCIDTIQAGIESLIRDRVEQSRRQCTEAISDYVHETRANVTTALVAVEASGRLRDEQLRDERRELLTSAVALLPAPS